MQHIRRDRLSIVAHQDDVIFTEAEFKHLKGCHDCFEVWSALIHELVHELVQELEPAD